MLETRVKLRGSTATAETTGSRSMAPGAGAMPRPSRRTRIRPERRVAPRIATVVLPIIAACIVVAVWQAYVVVAHIDPSILPSPLRVATQGWADRSRLWANTIPTLVETAVGFLLSITVSVVIAIACDFSTTVRRALEPLLVVSQTIPIISIAPLFVIWFGFETLPKALIVALVTFFPITVSLITGLNTTSVETTNLLRSMGAGRVRRFLLVRAPTAVPFFFSGVRISISFAVVGAIFAEYVGAEKGLGIYMQIAQNGRRPDLVLAAVFVTSVVSLLLYLLAIVVEKVVVPWNGR